MNKMEEIFDPWKGICLYANAGCSTAIRIGSDTFLELCVDGKCAEYIGPNSCPNYFSCIFTTHPNVSNKYCRGNPEGCGLHSSGGIPIELPPKINSVVNRRGLSQNDEEDDFANYLNNLNKSMKRRLISGDSSGIRTV